MLTSFVRLDRRRKSLLQITVSEGLGMGKNGIAKFMVTGAGSSSFVTVTRKQGQGPAIKRKLVQV